MGSFERIKQKFPNVDPVEFHELASQLIREQLKIGDIPPVIEAFIELEVEKNGDAILSHYEKVTADRREKQNRSIIKSMKISRPESDTFVGEQNPNICVEAGGLTPLHVLCMNKKNDLTEAQILEQVKVLCERYGADPSVLDNNKMKAVDRARIRGYKEVAKYLLEYEKRLISTASIAGNAANDFKD